MNFFRFFAVFKARNIEFLRDKSSLTWSLLFPILLLFGFSFVFSGDGRPAYKVGIITGVSADSNTQKQFMETQFIEFINYKTLNTATDKLSHHTIDLVIDSQNKQYWINTESSKSYLVEKIFSEQFSNYTRFKSNGTKIRYLDWVLPGVLGMNMMFSCLFGVGYAIVRYRKNSVLKRLKATPLSAFEFVLAQLFSRLFIVIFISSFIYLGCNFIFDFYMIGSYLDLFIVSVLGAFCLISLSLLVASRSKSEELTSGLLNLTSWPMMMLSGVWFSLEGAPQALKTFADFLPLTHVVAGARAIMIEGASLGDISYHINILLVMSIVFMSISAYLFSWNTER